MTKTDIHGEYICLGRIVRAHGIKGALSVKLDNPKSASLRPGIKIRVLSSKGVAHEETVASFSGGRILCLVGLDDRNDAEKLHQASIFINRRDFPPIEDDEIYLSDMIGFNVVDPNDVVIGSVSGFSDNTAQVLLEVLLTDGRNGFIPYVPALVKRVDSATQKISVDLPEGLFDSEKQNA